MRAAQARPRRRRSTRSGAASICSRRPASTPADADVLRRVRPQPRVLHRLRVRGQSRPSSAPRARSPAAAATTACSPTSARPRTCRPSARAIHTERLLAVLSGDGRHERAKLILALPSKGRLMEQCADMLAQGRAGRGASRARRAATRARSTGCRASRSTSSRPPRSPSSSRAARRTSASPARTWCARPSPMATSAWRS